MSGQKQSMSRVAHAHIQHAYKKAQRSQQFAKAHAQAQLSERVKDNKWYTRWWRAFTKFFGGGYDQKINQTAFGSQINHQSSEIKTLAMKVQKIYGFLRLMVRLYDVQQNLFILDNSTDDNIIWDHKLDDKGDRFSEMYYNYYKDRPNKRAFGSRCCTNGILIFLIIPKHGKSEHLKLDVFDPSFRKTAAVTDRLDIYRWFYPFNKDTLQKVESNISNNIFPIFKEMFPLSAFDLPKENLLKSKTSINKIYNHIISLSKSFVPPDKTQGI